MRGWKRAGQPADRESDACPQRRWPRPRRSWTPPAAVPAPRRRRRSRLRWCNCARGMISCRQNCSRCWQGSGAVIPMCRASAHSSPRRTARLPPRSAGSSRPSRPMSARAASAWCTATRPGRATGPDRARRPGTGSVERNAARRGGIAGPVAGGAGANPADRAASGDPGARRARDFAGAGPGPTELPTHRPVAGRGDERSGSCSVCCWCTCASSPTAHSKAATMSRSVLGLPCLGLIPRVSPPSAPGLHGRGIRARTTAFSARRTVASAAGRSVAVARPAAYHGGDGCAPEGRQDDGHKGARPPRRDEWRAGHHGGLRHPPPFAALRTPTSTGLVDCLREQTHLPEVIPRIRRPAWISSRAARARRTPSGC